MKSLARLLILLLVPTAFLSAARPVQAFECLFEHFGIGMFLHPVEKPDALCYPSCCSDARCVCCKDHVYIFAINGLNPMCLGNFNGFCEYLREEGYNHTYFYQPYMCFGLCKKICQVRQDDPCARIVLVGFSMGCTNARCIINALAKDCCRVDLVIYLAGDQLVNGPRSFPDNVGKVVNIRGKGLVFIGGDLIVPSADVEGALNQQVDCRHIEVPSRKETLGMVMTELLALSYYVPGQATVPATSARPATATPPIQRVSATQAQLSVTDVRPADGVPPTDADFQVELPADDSK